MHEVHVIGVKVPDVRVEHLAREHSLRHVSIVTIVGGPPESIVKVAEHKGIHENDNRECP
jgi:hypothetical protein